MEKLTAKQTQVKETTQQHGNTNDMEKSGWKLASKYKLGLIVDEEQKGRQVIWLDDL